MGIAIEFAMDSSSSITTSTASGTSSLTTTQGSTPKPNAVLIPELAFLIQQHLQPRDLAVASRVCRNWQEAWTPFLYYEVRYHHYHHHADTTLLQQHVVPFLNLEKYGRWMKSLEATNLVVAHRQSPCSSALAVSPSRSAVLSKASSAACCYSSSSASLSSCRCSVQDHLSQIQTSSSSGNLNLTQLNISKTVMSLERLDDLLGAVPMLKVFKFEVMNKKIDSAAMARELHASNGVGVHGSSAVSRGYMQQHQSNLLLKKPKRITLEGLEQEAVRIIARRLCGYLERLELVLSVTGTIVLSAFEELFTSCGSTLKALSLTRADICQRDSRRDWDNAYQAEIAALLASLSGTTVSANSQPWPQSSSLSSPRTMSMSSSSSSISSVYSTSASSSTSSLHESSDQPKTTSPVLESLSLYSCSVEDRECAWFLKHAPGLRELSLHDCQKLKRQIVSSILAHTPLLETLSLSSLPHLHSASLEQLFATFETSSEAAAISGSRAVKVKSGLKLKNVRLAYLRQLDDTVMKTLATHQGPSLVKLSLQWCPHVTDEGIIPIFESCERLEDLSLCLSKPTLDIFKELTESNETTGPAGGGCIKRLWACAQTLERLEIGGQMFVDRIRTSNEHLHPQLYHHMSPNPHHIRNGSTPLVTNGSNNSGSYNSGGANILSTNISSVNCSHSSNIIHDPYSIAHHQGYPMYHLRRYHRFSDPFRELQAQLETLPRLSHLGIPAKGIEHLIKKGFGPKVQLKSLALLNQQGRAWTPEELGDLLSHMPELRRLVCEKNTILAPLPSVSATHIRKADVMLLKRQEQVRMLLNRHHVELVQASSPSLGLYALPK